jgi:DNA-binding transcriptional ArsR family regulator
VGRRLPGRRLRAAILSCLALPKSTTDLARELGQSAPSVSFHLSVLRRNGLVTSWRSGRRVLYRRTPLASGLLAGGGSGF